VIKKKYILFDGSCGLCNSAVLFVAKRDIKDIFQLVSSQSQLGITLLKKHHIEGLERNSVILLGQQGQIQTKSKAVIYILKELPMGGLWSFLLRIIPNCIRDIVYDFIARNRSWFTQKNSCEIPSAAIRHKITSK
jgi:predicted DCC family thiol-disulfide oxidoreductase YuxK